MTSFRILLEHSEVDNARRIAHEAFVLVRIVHTASIFAVCADFLATANVESGDIRRTFDGDWQCHQTDSAADRIVIGVEDPLERVGNEGGLLTHRSAWRGQVTADRLMPE
jgi:hypothetical protein